jgi:hypothetical protein
MNDWKNNHFGGTMWVSTMTNKVYTSESEIDRDIKKYFRRKKIMKLGWKQNQAQQWQQWE